MLCRMSSVFRVVPCLAACIWISPASYAQDPAFDGLHGFIAEHLKGANVPGAAIAVVKKGEIVFKGTYGLRNIKENLPVDERTVFPVASVTKSFTALTLAALVDAGKLEWDRPVREYMPEFRLHDAAATELVTARDLLSHRTGIPRYEGLWFGSGFTRADILYRLRFLEPSAGFRSVWQYTNLTYVAAGLLGAKVDGGNSWEASVQSRLLDPLKMRATSFTVAEARKTGNFSLPYATGPNGMQEVPYWDLDSIAPASAINSNVEDMAQFLTFVVNGGKFGSRAIVSEKQMNQLTSAQIVVPFEPDYPLGGQLCYGLGWFVGTYRAHKLVYHPGTSGGFTSLVAFLPSERIGVVILTNKGGASTLNTISQNVWDRALGVPVTDWAVNRLRSKASAPDATLSTPAPPPAESPASPSHKLTDYVGVYEHPGFGTIEVGGGDAGLTAAFNNTTVKLKHGNYDVFVGIKEVGNFMSDQSLQFRLDVKGRIDALLWDVESNVPRAVFVRHSE